MRIKWAHSILDWRCHAVDEQRRHPIGVFKAECGHVLTIVVGLRDEPRGQICEACAMTQTSRAMTRRLTGDRHGPDAPAGHNVRLSAVSYAAWPTSWALPPNNPAQLAIVARSRQLPPPRLSTVIDAPETSAGLASSLPGREALHDAGSLVVKLPYSGTSADTLVDQDWRIYRRSIMALPKAIPQVAIPAIKFFKDAVEDILAGHKTLEPRPRTVAWIKRLERAGRASLTYGPRFGAPTVFATARITDIMIRSFETATSEDLERIGTVWRGENPERFVREYTRWFEKEISKGYPVAWISFEVV